MDFEQEFIEKNQLTEEQVTALNAVIDPHIADVRKIESSKANENAEGIIDGAIKQTTEKFGIEGFVRDKGEKAADVLGRIVPLVVDSSLAKEKTEVARLQKEYNEKLKTGGDENLKQELQEAKDKLDVLKKKEADYDELVKNDYKGKFEKSSQDLTKMQQRIAFKDNLPSRPDTVNEYEWDAKIKEFQAELLEKNNLVFDENDNAWLVDKENEFKKTKLKDVIKVNENIQKLIAGRDVKGIGSKPSDITIEGLPFKVPENPTATERQKLIRDYLTGEKKLSITSDEYAKEYKKFNDLILKKN